MILTVGNTKGGTGKSTLAVNIAIHRARTESVLLVDGDEQQSALSFTQLRNQNDYAAVALTGKSLHQQVPKLNQKYPEVIIDVGGRDSHSFRAALTITNLLLIPVQPRTFDVWAMESLMELIQEAITFNPSLKCLSVLSLADSQGRENEAAAERLMEFQNIHYCQTPIRRRKVYADAITQGKGIAEMKPRNLKAIAEFQQFIQCMDNLMIMNG